MPALGELCSEILAADNDRSVLGIWEGIPDCPSGQGDRGRREPRDTLLEGRCRWGRMGDRYPTHKEVYSDYRAHCIGWEKGDLCADTREKGSRKKHRQGCHLPKKKKKN